MLYLLTNNHIYIGASHNVFSIPEELPTAGLAHFLLECALEQIDQDLHKLRIINWNTGNRPALIDNYPLIGETSIEGLWLISRTHRDGFHQSPLIAQDIANKILGKSGLITHNLFVPERKLLFSFTKDEAIEHYISGTDERAMKLAKAGWGSLLREVFKKRLEELYEKLNITYGLTPDILLMFEFAKD